MDKAPDAFRIISEVADELDVPQHVLRFWETRFSQIRPMKRSGGRRYYRPDDVDLLRGIRHLLYGEGYTIRGVQRILREHGAKAVIDVARGQKLPPSRKADTDPADADFDAGADLEGDESGFPDIEAADDGADALAHGPVGSERREPVMNALNQPASARPAQDMREPIFSQPTFNAPAGAGASLRIDDARKLEAALHELQECRRLIEAALGAAR